MQVRTSIFLTMLMVAATLGPIVAPQAIAQNQSNAEIPEIIGDIEDFDVAIHGKPYIMTENETIYSATRLHKMAWADAGYPNLVLPFANNHNGKSTTKACTPMTEGQTLTVPISGGTLSVEVAKSTTNAAYLVESTSTVPSSTINNLASTWTSTIHPTNTQYFGNEPDVDNNCQVQIVIYTIDGPANIGGYFSPGIANSQEAIYVDIDDLTWANTIFAHEFQHLLHNARDPFEYLWVDEGNADMAAYLCFGATNTIIGHANAWAQFPETSVRWWNQSDNGADYGAGFLFMLFLSSKLGGGQAIQSLVADTATGGAGVVNLANNPIPGSPGNIGTTMPDIFANFTIATLLDDSQNPFGLDNIDMYQNCGNSQFCRMQITDSNSNWGSVWQRQGDDLYGWGVRAYKFTGGTGSPLNVMVQASETDFAGRLVYKNIATGTWTAEPLIFNGGVATGLVTDFGNVSDEAYVITWYESLVDDCDYAQANCGWPGGGSSIYPTGTVDVYATLISQPATIRQDGMRMHDRDNDTLDDTMEWILEVNSTAFWETLDIKVQAFNNNTLYDEIDIPIGVGQGNLLNRSVWFTPPWDGDWQLYARLFDQVGNPVENAAVLTLATTTHNMAPVATGSLSSNTSQTWLPIQFNGAGYDIWGLSSDNQTYTHNASPAGYIWDFGDGVQSWLRTPSRAYTSVGEYNSSLRVTDVGGKHSIPQNWSMNITDTIMPTVKISVGGQEVMSEMVLLTTQRVMFEAYMTDDNVPDEYLDFQWDWGDGTSEGGVGYIEAPHDWDNGSANGTIYSLVLTVSDGVFVVNKTLNIIILNRIPRQIYDLPMEVDTLTPLPLPTMFTDDDGTITSWQWIFYEDVNLDGGELTKLSVFDQNGSTDENPTPAWLTPGQKSITIIATDNDGNQTMAILHVTVNNQRPVALFDRPDDGDTNTSYMFQSHSWDPDGENGNLSTIWTISEGNITITNQTSVMHTFTTPGTHVVELIVIDERGLASLPKAYIIEISNPLPIPMMTIYEALYGTTGNPIDVPGEDESNYNWRHTFTDSGDIFVAPGRWLKFNSSGSRDGDSQYEGMDIPLDQNDPQWNGIVEYTWDFGDGSPLVNSPNVWHTYTTPGLYTITLTLRDGFGTGDVNQTTRKVFVASAPEIVTSKLFDDAVYSEGEYLMSGSAIDHDGTIGFDAWWDDNVFVDSDGNGIYDDDHDVAESIVGQLALVFSWDLDDRIDVDSDGDNTNDWVEEGNDGIVEANWTEAGEIFVALKVCNGIGVCTEKGFPLRIRDPSEKDDAIADFSLDSLLPKAESSGLLLGVLLVILLILGWLVMRQPTEIEAEASAESENYDVTSVVSEGGVLGMDQHAPPPKPKHLTTTDRRSMESGYVRPVTSRRRR